MMNEIESIRGVEADLRWSEWLARGAARDRRAALRMRKWIFLIAAAFAVWCVVQFT